MFPADELEEFKALHGEIFVGQEGNEHFILIPNKTLPDGCSPVATDVLYFPNPRDGYKGRLFFPTKVKNGPNWNTKARIMEREWHAYSWQTEKEGGRLAQKFSVLLRGLR